MDWNVQCDTRASAILAERAKLTLVPLPVTLRAHLRGADLPRVRASGPVGELLALQSEVHGRDRRMVELGRAHPGLPDDLVNFHYDPLTCAVALGWPGATIDEVGLEVELEGGLLRFRRSEAGRAMRVVRDVDAEGFTRAWLQSLEAIP
jgi:inosine-uridine nucleoside N-ribohydrolase